MPAAFRSIKIAKQFADIVLGFTPFIGTAKDLYEAIAGQNPVTGAKLSFPERSLSALSGAVSLMTLGTSNVITKGSLKAIEKIGSRRGKAAATAVERVVQTVEKIADSAVHARVKTPYGEAVQEMTRDALTARVKVSEGGTMYRVGTRGRNQTGKDAQFWSLEHPSTPGYGKKYGIPEENLRNHDFIETATVKPDAPFITRPAPPSPDGKNPGGGIEIVVPEGSVNIKSHSSL